MGVNLEKLKRSGYSALAAITILATSITSCNSLKSNPNEVEKERIGTPTFTYVPTDTDTPLPPTDTLTPEPTDTIIPTEERKSSVMDNLEGRTTMIRADRAQNDPDYMNRINPELAEKYVANILFVGRRKGTGPSDTYKLLSVQRDGEIDTTSFARDFYIPEFNSRINGVYWYEERIQTTLIPVIENITGIPVDYFVYLDNQDLIVEMIDVLGTVDVEIKRNCGKFKKGTMEMSGKLAAEYFVQRYCDTDWHRNDRQTQVIEAMLREVKQQVKSDSLRGLKNVKNMYNLVVDYQDSGDLVFNTASPNIDEDMDDMYNFGFSFLADALLGRVTWPKLGENVNYGTAGLFYSPWSGNRRYVLSAINKVNEDLPKYSARKLRGVYYKSLRDYTAEILLND